MIDNLKRLVVFTCASKLWGFPLRGYDGQTESDVSRLKKGIRSNYDLQWHEAWFRVLRQNGLLDVFREKASKLGHHFNVNFSRSTIQQAIVECEKQAKLNRTNAQTVPQHYDHYMRYVRHAERQIELFKIMQPFEQDVAQMYTTLPLKRNKLIDWKDIDSVQFYSYHPETNSFVEFDHKVK